MNETNDNGTGFIITLIVVGSIILIMALIELILKIREWYILAKPHKLKPNDLKIEYYNIPGILNCPCCKSQDILTVARIKFPEIQTKYSSYEPISFVSSETYITWVIECDECGMQTKEFYSIDKAILNWNGRSESTELIKTEV